MSHTDVHEQYEHVGAIDGLDVYADKKSGQAMYVGHPTSKNVEAQQTENRIPNPAVRERKSGTQLAAERTAAETNQLKDIGSTNAGEPVRRNVISMISWLGSSAIAAFLIYQEAGLKSAIICTTVGVASFFLCAAIRTEMMVRDPVQRLSLAATGKPRGKEKERIFAQVIIPIVVAFWVKALLFA